MEIVVERIAKKETYTIGRLYLLADGDELPHLAPSSDESHPGGGESGRRYLDYHHLKNAVRCKFLMKTRKICSALHFLFQSSSLPG